MSYYLCGHTGNVNRGCEAIVRSTVKVLSSTLNEPRGNMYCATFSPAGDRKMSRELGINLIAYAGYPTRLHQYASAIHRRAFRHSLAGIPYIAAPLYARMSEDDVSLNIGGDTYCGNRPLFALSLNRYTSKHHIPNIMWCCSIEQNVMHGEILKDLQTYSYIFAREPLTYQYLLEAGVPKERVVKVVDPAFFLDRKEVPLPEGFVNGNTIGVNLSETVVKNDEIYGAVLAFIRHLMKTTDFGICLIPHVYSIQQNLCDYPVLTRLHQDLAKEPEFGRVSIVREEYDCEQLKYIISHCRFMICARTHASIAAYSTEVPTLVLGYSIKSKGIATELFGTDENYVVHYQNIRTPDTLARAFDFIRAHETDIRQHLHEILPAYKQQLVDAVKTYFGSKYEDQMRPRLCDRALCTGCGACAAACPAGAIRMKTDDEGFDYPAIDTKVCTQCRLCERICPVSNRRCTTDVPPISYAAVHQRDDIREMSSSGGVFSAIASTVIENGGVVVGAVLDEDLHVRHAIAEKIEDIAPMRGSKYVQSDLNGIFPRVRSYLDTGRRVLFTGTPCQIGGLYAYLRHDYDNLYTQDIICHGVPSPAVWDAYVRARAKKAGSPVVGASFRDKSDGWESYSLRLDFSDGHAERALARHDPYMNAFASNLCLRPSCHTCAYKHLQREADITLADQWRKEGRPVDMDDGKGISLVLLHTAKGTELLDACGDKLRCAKTDLTAAIKENPSVIRPASASPLRGEYLRRARKLRHIRQLKRFTSASAPARAWRLIKKSVKRS